MTPEEIVDRWAFTGCIRIISVKLLVYHRMWLQNSRMELKNKKRERRRADANKSEENETLSTNDSDDDEVISAEMTKSEIIERSQRNLETKSK